MGNAPLFPNPSVAHKKAARPQGAGGRLMHSEKVRSSGGQKATVPETTTAAPAIEEPFLVCEKFGWR